jgi:hypothetical protein
VRMLGAMFALSLAAFGVGVALVWKGLTWRR